MRALIQRVSRASVRVDGEEVGAIGRGLLVLLGVGKGDRENDAQRLAKKIAQLRIFGDDAGKMNCSVQDVSGSCLVVSQFTLFADVRRGRRPFFGDAAAPELAAPLCEHFVSVLRDESVEVATGRFAAQMEVELVNDGPVTLWLDSTEL